MLSKYFARIQDTIWIKQTLDFLLDLKLLLVKGDVHIALLNQAYAMLS